ncbi:MAG TPA: four helix bundle protein [Pyrinomonadaceae bacterium]|nr:four helix bundle protein [Pyrinomonadaceae bacterium]
MGKFSKFEEIQAWQKAKDATLAVYQITSNSEFAKDFGLKDQIRRASVSIMANIAEGHGRKTNVEFANFLNIARGSVAEVQSHLYVAIGLKYIDQTEFDELYQTLTEISRMILALAQYLRSTAK